MIDRDGYRPNVGIILCNPRNEVFWGKRIREHSWQFPQGGIKYGESPEYWVPLESVIEFKRDVYKRALSELEPQLRADKRDRHAPRNAVVAATEVRSA